MPADTELPYLDLRADERLEVRVPSLLKQHAEVVASARHKTVSEFVISVLAAAVGEGLAEVSQWHLTIPEQQELLSVLAQPATHSPGMTAARARADQLFGPTALD